MVFLFVNDKYARDQAEFLFRFWCFVVNFLRDHDKPMGLNGNVSAVTGSANIETKLLYNFMLDDGGR